MENHDSRGTHHVTVSMLRKVLVDDDWPNLNLNTYDLKSIANRLNRLLRKAEGEITND